MIPNTGPINFRHGLYGIAHEFGGAKPDKLSEYYRGGPNVPAGAKRTIATSGTQKFSNYRGAQKIAAPPAPPPAPVWVPPPRTNYPKQIDTDLITSLGDHVLMGCKPGRNRIVVICITRFARGLPPADWTPTWGTRRGRLLTRFNIPAGVATLSHHIYYWLDSDMRGIATFGTTPLRMSRNDANYLVMAQKFTDVTQETPRSYGINTVAQPINVAPGSITVCFASATYGNPSLSSGGSFTGFRTSSFGNEHTVSAFFQDANARQTIVRVAAGGAHLISAVNVRGL